MREDTVDGQPLPDYFPPGDLADRLAESLFAAGMVHRLEMPEVRAALRQGIEDNPEYVRKAARHV